jgi:hypothetical protein
MDPPNEIGTSKYLSYVVASNDECKIVRLSVAHEFRKELVDQPEID